MKQPVRIAAFAFGLLALAAAAFQYYQRGAGQREQALASARRGAAWLSALQIPLKDPGILWIISAIDRKYCHEPRVREYVKEHFAEFDGRKMPIFPALRGLSLDTRDDNFEAFSEGWQLASDKSPVIQAMAWAVYCDRVPMPEAVGHTVFATDRKGYELTHQYLALLYMEQNACLKDHGALGRVAQAIADEEAHDGVFSDLWVERVALLLHGDERRLVQTAWIESLLQQQQPSGAWSDPKFPQRYYQTPENPHTTALAVFALSEFAGGCPFE